MSRLIDADALVEKCGNWYTEEGTEEGFIGTLKSLIDEQPTIGGWVSVEDKLPEETDSIFARHYGTDKWANAMWRSNSARVIVAVTLDDGSSTVATGTTHDGKWHTSISDLLKPKVTHWMPMPEPPEAKHEKVQKGEALR